MTLDWSSIASGVVTELIVASILGLGALCWIFAKRLARCLARAASISQRGVQKLELAQEWEANIQVSSRGVALQFAWSIWWHRKEIANTIDRGEQDDRVRLSAEAVRFIRAVGLPRAAFWASRELLTTTHLLPKFFRARGNRARTLVLTEAYDQAAGRWIESLREVD